ncbi:hypothetical protein FAZ19_09915 [Sphingobacterium alkalisoli]|uniref:Uncharacterized protein n=1 Tax=Sphingobacterium alkalisoli TaxID=1874115 RepID=A0A4U0H562_9SPHI|nr:hypothetical protein [Sphingobacterium alkalisoli]TJY65452.1 hypothetical protein FAZ19_09915 [Sphingobacterium alkalisoli]GGH20380.1 hypothetical protein GCM10011418_25530 [Sphingobacterium alkalisoli]
MKNQPVSLLTSLFFLTALYGCSGVSQKEHDKLKEENKALQEQIDELKFGPSKLISQAKIYIDNKNFNKAKSEIETLMNKHPSSRESAEARQLVPIVNKGIKDQELAKERLKLEKERNEKQRLANATKKLRTNYDDIKEVTWYYDRGTPQYTNYNSFHIYIGKTKNGAPWLRLRIQYTGDDWLFIEKYVIKTDTDSYTIETTYRDVDKDNGSGAIWEWYDAQMNDKLYRIVKEVIKSKSAKIRHNGKQYYEDRTITQKEKQSLQNILDAYEVLGGKTDF